MSSSEADALVTTLDDLVEEALATFDDVASLSGLNEAAAAVLGKRSSLGAVKQQLGALAPDERKVVGRAANEARTRIQARFDERQATMQEAERRAQLEAERLDLTEHTSSRRLGHLHLVTQTWQALEDVFVGMGFTVAEGPEIETDWYNFEALNFPEGHTARDMFDTLYVDVGQPESTLLRTHTSPVQVRVMERSEPPIYTISPGRVFRRDTADATHMPVFHQIEGLVVDEGITFGDLAGTMEAFTKAYFGGDFTSRLRPSYFPFTEPSAEFDIRLPDGTWLELGGSGMVHPNVLANCHIDPERFSGFAFGFGIDRLALVRHDVDDLRELYRNDVRFLRQF